MSSVQQRQTHQLETAPDANLALEPLVNTSLSAGAADYIGGAATSATVVSDKEMLDGLNQADRIPTRDLRSETPLPSDTYVVHKYDGSISYISRYPRQPSTKKESIEVLGPGQSTTGKSQPLYAIISPKNRVISNRGGKLYVNGRRKRIG